MLNKNFYPTPNYIIGKMLRQLGIKDIHNMNILEPSVGKGDIVKFLKENYRHAKKNIFGIENDEELFNYCQSQGIQMLGRDFLTFTTDYHFDLIIMNPPFDNGVKHLLKAWSLIEKTGGQIVCLLNKSNIDNLYSKERELLNRLIESFGTIENFGKCFEDAERATSVEVVCITLKKELSKEENLFEGMNYVKGETKDLKDFLGEGCISDEVGFNDVIGNKIRQYDKAKEAFVELLNAYEKIEYYTKGIVSDSFKGAVKEIIAESGDKKVKYNSYLKRLKIEVWKDLLKQLKIERLLTNKVNENFTEFINNQSLMELTKENIQEVVRMLFFNQNVLLESAVREVFDLFTSYYKENRYIPEGWKTNSHYKVNRKIILPNWVIYEANSWSDWRLDYRTSHRYDDIDKVMCYITGKKYEEGTVLIKDVLEERFKVLNELKSKGGFDGECESEFFYIKFFKKGTVHLKFKDEFLWQEFNTRACKGKNWLG